MRLTTLVAMWIVRLAGLTQIVIGLLIWSGRALTLIPMHMGIGFLVVLGLWTIAILALVAKTRSGLAIFALPWGVALPAFGMQQANILPGPSHWIIRLVHLTMALAALWIADALAKAVLKRGNPGHILATSR